MLFAYDVCAFLCVLMHTYPIQKPLNTKKKSKKNIVPLTANDYG